MEFVSLVWPYVTYKISEFIKKCFGESVIAQTSYGPIKGIKQTSNYGYDYLEFRGVPYAKPPIGELRFRNPVPPEPWTEPLQTTADTYACQKEYIFKQYLGCEDCLHLNIYTKHLNSVTLYPVMVYIHGGGLQFGSNTKDLQNPEFLLRENIVFIVINYRLGALGFLSLTDPDLKIPGNAGLKDQVFALKWIKENVSNFGGDANNITIFGNSAGGCSVHYHMLSKMSENLFHKAICMSGTALNIGSYTPDANATEKLAKILGWNGKGGQKKLLEVLQKAKAKAIIEAQEKLLTKDHKQFLQFLFVPIVEPYESEECFLPKHPLKMCEEAWSQNIPLMIGGCSNEGLFIYRDVVKDNELFRALSKSAARLVPISIEADRTTERCMQLGEAIKQKYFGYTDISEGLILTYLQMMGDLLCWHGIHRTILARMLFPKSAPTFLYRFNYESLNLNHAKIVMVGKNVSGACHGDECSYIFKNAVTGKINENSKEAIAIDRMIKFWTTFAISGNPNNTLNQSTPWHPVQSSELYKCMDISDELTFKEPPELERMIFWETIYGD